MWLIVLQVAVQSLWNMRLAVFVKPEHEGRVNHVSTASVRTGLGNTLGGFNLGSVSRHPVLNTRADSAHRSRRRKCVFNGPQVTGQMFALPQGTRGLSAFPFTSMEHRLGLWTATWLLEVKKSWGASCARVFLCASFCQHTADDPPVKIHVQEEPELCGHPPAALSGWKEQRVWPQPALHPSVLVWRPQLPARLWRAGQHRWALKKKTVYWEMWKSDATASFSSWSMAGHSKTCV